MWILKTILKHLFATIFICSLAHGESEYSSKPWPTYSLQNMPKTQFSCRDKILGGYYADAQTQCQMFHICVKIAGVGVQDFKFLCPNGTAFDQEAQICAYWSDVDCQPSILYYGTDNFDLYRVGSGFENKRAPLAEEEESTFHLQRAETADLRRSKETRVDQKTHPEQSIDYSRQFDGFTNTRNRNQQQPQRNRIETTRKPIVSYYTPTPSTTTTTTTEKYSNADESKQEYDDIFKGSHSSHFFANRNGGREDDFIDHPQRKPNDFTDYSKKAETSTISKTRVHTTRIKRPHIRNSTTTSTTFAPSPPFSSNIFASSSNSTKKTTIQTFFGTNYFGFSPTSTTAAATVTTTTTTTTSRPVISNAQRFNLNTNDFPEKIKPSTNNPGNSIFRLKSTTPKNADGIKKSNLENLAKSNPTISSRNTQKSFNEFQRLKVQQPHPFQPSPVFRPPLVSPKEANETNEVNIKTFPEQQFSRVRGQPITPLKISKQEPSPFAIPQRSRGTTTDRSKTSTSAAPIQNPRGFTSRGSINYKTSTIKGVDSYVQTPAQLKKFSTLVPREQYTSTTPQKKNYEYNFYQTPQTTLLPKKTQKSVYTTSTTPLPSTANPYYNPDEDDGQYHPELYELEYSYDRYNLLRSSKSSTTTTTTTTTPKPLKKLASINNNNNNNNPQIHLKTQQQTSFQKQQEQVSTSDLSDEDELFKTAQSLNFGAASINKLRADIIKAEKNSQQYNSQYSPQSAQTASPTTSTTIAPFFSYATNATPLALVTSKPFKITAATSTSQRAVTTTTTARFFENVKGTKSTKGTKNTGLGKKSSKKSSSKRPPHADEDTSYDYAYYDTDTLSESPQDYPEYNIQEFTKTRKN